MHKSHKTEIDLFCAFCAFLWRIKKVRVAALGALIGPPTLKTQGKSPLVRLTLCLSKNVLTYNTHILARRCVWFFQFVVIFISYLLLRDRDRDRTPARRLRNDGP
jgi:hypothetical protein